MRCDGLLHRTCGTNDNPWRYDLCGFCNTIVAQFKHNPMRQVGEVDDLGVRTVVWDEQWG
jgi:hypothetical protein